MMAFLRIKRIKKWSYLYLVKSVWDKKKQSSRQKVIKYYGKIENGHIDDKIVYERDNHQCQVCNKKSNLTIEHKIPTSCGGKDEYDNVWVLCKSCKKVNGEIYTLLNHKFRLLTKLKFWNQAYENEYRKRQKEKNVQVNKELMRKSILQRKMIKNIIKEIRTVGIDQELKDEGYM